MAELIAAFFIIGVGMSVSGMATHLYQGLSRQVAGFRFYGETALESVLNIFIVFICGPYLMLRTGWSADSSGKISTVNVMLAAFIAFAWSFVTGLTILGTYLSVLRMVV